ncbi:dihydrodipicolinate synthase family protein [Paenibacillus sp.]|uniref:dihydrodipicolinate synthase family protein n=1 Tax=Paenibacillus sp. TaxID=58172 RepID=UPI00281115D1|nr:dihydrodipicolinate synthase family protein [Paenibacillus sp.]
MKLHGVIPILPAPFTEDGTAVDHEDLRSVIDLAVSEGAHGVALLGVASEFYKLADDERSAMIRTTVEHVAGRVPVIVNITRHSTELAVRDARDAQAVGADAVMIVPPSFIAPSAAAIMEHIEAVAASVDLPVVIQYAPNVTGVGIPAETFLRIQAACRNDMYIKAESVPPGPLISSIAEGTSGAMGVFIGNGGVQLFDALERGAAGLMPGTAMLKPYMDIYTAYREGNKELAFERFNAFLPVLNLTAQGAEMFTRFEKIILKARGAIKSDACRKPYFSPDEGYRRLLAQYGGLLSDKFGVDIFPRGGASV